MSHENQCPECGAAIPAGSPEALCPACLLRRGFETRPAADPDAPLPTPESLASRFPQLEIVELLGRGGMGAVYKARHRSLDRWVALKILPAAAERDPAFAERFSREAKALAHLAHPHIVAVYDSGEADGLFYFIMEYVDGATLRQILASGGMTPEQALAIVPQICEALQYAHDRGIVHRDIKPENILVDKSGRVKIADFGIAKIAGREPSDFTLTTAGEVMRTPAYMAPEQVEHPGSVDHRADIYSLGVVFYQMLTGELPLGRFAPPSRKVRVDVRLDEVVLRTLEKEPERRYQQAGEVKTEVETIAGSPGAAVPAPATPRKPGHSRRWWLQPTVIFLFLALFCLTAAVIVRQWHPKPAALSKTPEKRDLSPVERFQAALQGAADRRDKEALLALINLEGVSKEDRETIASYVERILSWPEVRAECHRRLDPAPLRAERNGKTLTLNGPWVLDAALYNADPNLPSAKGFIFQAGRTPGGMKILTLVEAGHPAAWPPQSWAEAGQGILEIHAVAEAAGPGAKEYRWVRSQNETETILLEPEVLLDDLNVRSVKVERDPSGGYSLRVTLDEEGKNRFGELTARRLGKRIGFVVDGKLLSAPVVRDPIMGGNFSIGNGLTEPEAGQLAAKLEKAIHEQTISFQHRAAGFVDLLARGDFAKARAGFDPTMSAALSEEALGTLWAQLQANGGKFLGHDTPRQESVVNFTVVYVPCRWERARLDLKVVYDRAGRISGLWIVPPGDSMLGKPAAP